MSQPSLFPAIRRLAEYETWCNARLLGAAAELSEPDLFRRFPIGLETVHHTLFHTLAVFGAWTNQIGPEQAEPQFTSYTTDTLLAELRRWNEQLALRFLGEIDASHAAAVLSLDRRIEQVFHLVTHGTHHRTQCITMLKKLGVASPYEPGDFGGWSHPKKNP